VAGTIDERDWNAKLDRRQRQNAKRKLGLRAPAIRAVVGALEPKRREVEIEAVALGRHRVLDPRRPAGVEVVVVRLRASADAWQRQQESHDGRGASRSGPPT
jgi:hypothetical protein